MDIFVAEYSLRFDDASLQEAFVSALTQSGVPHALGLGRAVECSKEQWLAVNDVAHTIRDSCFRWYFSWCDTPEGSAEFLAALKRSGLPFKLEHHKDRDVFLLSRSHEAEYLELSLQAGGDAV